MNEWEEVLQRAFRAVDDNVRHSSESLFNLLDQEFPNAPDWMISQATARALCEDE